MRLLFAAALAALLLSSPAFAGTCTIMQFGDISRSTDRATVIQASGVETASPSSVATTGASAQSAAFASATTYIRVVCDEVTRFRLGLDPTATTSHPWVGANTPEYFGVERLSKIAFIDPTP